MFICTKKTKSTTFDRFTTQSCEQSNSISLFKFKMFFIIAIPPLFHKIAPR